MIYIQTAFVVMSSLWLFVSFCTRYWFGYPFEWSVWEKLCARCVFGFLYQFRHSPPPLFRGQLTFAIHFSHISRAYPNCFGRTKCTGRINWLSSIQLICKDKQPQKYQNKRKLLLCIHIRKWKRYKNMSEVLASLQCMLLGRAVYAVMHTVQT